ncbi:MAG: MBL fold metallo-hydrolase [Nocardioidaceae bacterium]|nr:MBL fold metallo-hydrolase [Nocardioidaceae bacterium]
MEIISFRTPGLGDQTYLVAHEGKAVLVDPQRDIDRFLGAAADRDLDLRFVLETHLHNDYVSGGQQAALRTGAQLILPAASAAAYRHTPAFHLEDIAGEDGLTIRPIHTPGHTPEHTSYLILLDGKEVAVFSGGSLLVGSAGRPDLLGPERADTLARLQHISINRLAALPPDVELLPTHGEGSFCTATGAGRLTSTIGEEIASNPLLACATDDDLAHEMLRSPMPIPGFYRYMGPANTLGVKPLPERRVPRLSVAEVEERTDVHIVDMRPRQDQAKGVLRDTVAVEFGDDFGSWVGWLVPYNEPIVIVANPDQDVEAAITQLHQIQFDNIVGIVNDVSGATLHCDFELVDIEAARRLVEQGDMQVLDVRMPNERATQGRYPGAVERFVADIFTQGIPSEINKYRPVLIACASGRRAVIAASRLTSQGYDVRVMNPGGIPDLTGAEA